MVNKIVDKQVLAKEVALVDIPADTATREIIARFTDERIDSIIKGGVVEVARILSNPNFRFSEVAQKADPERVLEIILEIRERMEGMEDILSVSQISIQEQQKIVFDNKNKVVEEYFDS